MKYIFYSFRMRSENTFFLINAVVAVLFLTGCGGGGSEPVSTSPVAGETPDGDQDQVSGSSSPVPVTDSGGPPRIYSISEHVSQRHAYIAVEAGEDAERFVALADPRAQFDLYTGDSLSGPNITYSRYVDSHSYGETYLVEYSVLDQDFESYFYFQNETDGSMYIASIDQVESSELPFLVAGGPELDGVPSGSFTYRGAHMVLQPFAGVDHVNYIGNHGTFALTVNFDTGQSNLTANASNVRVYASNVQVDPTNGTLSSENLVFEDKVFDQVYSGELTGTFTGVNASGVAGVYSTNGNEFFGAIAGMR